MHSSQASAANRGCHVTFMEHYTGGEGRGGDGNNAAADASSIRRLSRANEKSTSIKCAPEGASSPLSSSPTAESRLLPARCPLAAVLFQRLRVLSHRCCPSGLLDTGSGGATRVAAALSAALDTYHSEGMPDKLSGCYSQLPHQGAGSTGATRARSAVPRLWRTCTLPIRFMRHLLCPASLSSTSTAPAPPPRRLSPRFRRRSSRVALVCGVTTVIAVACVSLLFAFWAAATLMLDPYTHLRLQLQCASETLLVVSQPQTFVPGNDGGSGLLQSVASTAVQLRLFVEEMIVQLLSHFLLNANCSVNTKPLLNKPILVPQMLGEHDALFLQDEAVHQAKAHRSVGVFMTPQTRAAVLQCAASGVQGTPLNAGGSGAALLHHRGHSSATAFGSLFLNTSTYTPLVPQCLARRQPRLSCTDVHNVESTAGSALDNAATAPAPASKQSSRIQHLYELTRVRVDATQMTRLYWESTPGLPAEESVARNEQAVHAELTDTTELPNARVRAQEARFRHSTPGNTSAPLARRASGVILILSGDKDRNPTRRENDFTQHALPLLEKNFLSRYPHYPLHIFFEAATPTAAWTLPEVLRCSDVYTVCHSCRPHEEQWNGSHSTSTPHVPPPPPLLVSSTEHLTAVEQQQATLHDWFHRLASIVPSAPYVTFENVAPLFSTLPCDITEATVAAWMENPQGVRSHRRGYRQMCRFWARLVWRLPSLRVWTDSMEGQAEAAAYATVDGIDTPTTATAAAQATPPRPLPPWRFRYAYYWRLDSDSYLHTPVLCDPFHMMAVQRCAYGYRTIHADMPRATLELGAAVAEWLTERTVLPSRQSSSRPAATTPFAQRGGWGTLTDPAQEGFVTFDSTPAVPSALLSPPLPPTWPWPSVYPPHSSAALSAAEQAVLSAYFFDRPVTREPHFSGLRTNTAFAGGAQTGDRATAPPPPNSIASPNDFPIYNRFMYYNNFELGTFALKTHPLYTSLVVFLDNSDSDDVPAAERDAASDWFTLQFLNVTRDSRGSGTNASANPVYQLTRTIRPVSNVSGGPRGLHGGGRPATTSATACRGVLRSRADERQWRSGYLQYRWGDAPVHTIGVEAVMQREGWSVCVFAEDMGAYAHGRFPRT